MIYPLNNFLNIRRGYEYGDKTWYSKFHLGTDYIVDRITSIFATEDGETIWSGYGLQLGWTCFIRVVRPEGIFIIRHGHLFRQADLGEHKEGDVVAFSGNTGTMTRTPHIHTDVSKNKVDIRDITNFVDPDLFFKQTTMATNAKLVKDKNTPAHGFWLPATSEEALISMAKNLGKELPLTSDGLLDWDAIVLDGIVEFPPTD